MVTNDTERSPAVFPPAQRSSLLVREGSPLAIRARDQQPLFFRSYGEPIIQSAKGQDSRIQSLAETTTASLKGGYNASTTTDQQTIPRLTALHLDKRSRSAAAANPKPPRRLLLQPTQGVAHTHLPSRVIEVRETLPSITCIQSQNFHPAASVFPSHTPNKSFALSPLLLLSQNRGCLSVHVNDTLTASNTTTNVSIAPAPISTGAESSKVDSKSIMASSLPTGLKSTMPSPANPSDGGCLVKNGTFGHAVLRRCETPIAMWRTPMDSQSLPGRAKIEQQRLIRRHQPLEKPIDDKNVLPYTSVVACNLKNTAQRYGPSISPLAIKRQDPSTSPYIARLAISQACEDDDLTLREIVLRRINPVDLLSDEQRMFSAVPAIVGQNQRPLYIPDDFELRSMSGYVVPHHSQRGPPYFRHSRRIRQACIPC